MFAFYALPKNHVWQWQQSIDGLLCRVCTLREAEGKEEVMMINLVAWKVQSEESKDCLRHISYLLPVFLTLPWEEPIISRAKVRESRKQTGGHHWFLRSFGIELLPTEPRFHSVLRLNLILLEKMESQIS